MRKFFTTLLVLLVTSIVVLAQVPECLDEGRLVVDPLPDSVTLTYPPGTVVNFCYSVERWYDGNTNEWLHSISIDMGTGWDYSTLDYEIPPSCSGQGYWDWYESWTSSATGLTFGPGFAFDSSLEGPIDGNPGNNYGDGGSGCNIISNPMTFCWTVEVRDDLPPNTPLELDVVIDVLSDGRSGSWSSDECSGMIDYVFSPATYFAETVLDFTATQYVCDSTCTAQLVISTSVSNWQHRLLDQYGNIIMEDTFPSGIDTIFDLCPAFYSLESVPLSNNMLVIENNFSVTSLPTPIPVASFEDPVCFNESPQLYGDAEGSDNFHVSYHWEGPDGYATDIRDPDDGPGAGMYILTASVWQCTEGSDTIIVPEYPNPALIVMPGSQVNICPGEVVQLSASGAQLYRWYANGNLVIVSPVLITAPTTTTLYTVEGTVSGAVCDGYGEVLVVVNDFAEQDLGPDRNVCLGQTITLGSNNQSLEYLWSTGATTSSIDVTPTIPTSYAVTVTAPQGCGAEFDVLLTPVAPGDLTVTASSTLLCEGDSSLLVASYSGGTSPYNFIWSNGATSDSIWVHPNNNTTYNLTMTDGAGCTVETSIDLQVVNIEATIIATDTVICSGQTTLLSVEENAAAYSWSTGQISQSIEVSPISTETYEVTITDINGCIKIDDIVIDVVASPNVPVINCTSTTSSINFTWEPISGFIYEASSLAGAAGLQTDGSYMITGLSPNDEVTMQLVTTSPDGCEVITEQTCAAIDCPTIELEITNDLQVCQNEASIMLEAEVTGGNGNGSITWGGNCINDPATGEFDPQLCGPGTYQVIAVYSEGPCVYQTAAQITILPNYTADFSIPSEACLSDTVTVQYTGDAPDDGIFNWNFGPATVLSGSGVGPYSLQWPNAGDYAVELSIGGDCPSETVSQIISISAPLEAPEVSCDLDLANGTIHFSWNAIAGASGYQLSLNGDNLADITETEISFDSFAPGETATLQVTAINNSPCTNATGDASCMLPPCPDLLLNLTEINICPGENVPLITSYSPDATYSWSPATGLSCTDCPNPVAMPNASTTYTVTASTANGCEESAEVTIIVTPLPSILLEDSYEVCLGETVELCLQNVQMVIWTGPNGYYYENSCLIIPDFAEENSGTYYMEVTFLDGCTFNDSLDILALPALEIVQIPEQIEVCPNQIFTLSAEVNNAAFYYWFPIKNVFCPNCPTTLASITQPTTFTLIVLDEAGCEMRFEIPAVIPPGCQQVPDIDDPIFLTGTGNDGPVDMILFPNPSRDQVTVQWNQEVEGNLQVFDTQGKLLLQMPVADQMTVLDLQALPSGVYWVRWTSEQGTISKKLLKE